MARPQFAPGSRHAFTVKRPIRGQALACYLAARLSLPAPWARTLLRQDCVRIAGEVQGEAVHRALPVGTTIEVLFPDAWPPHLQPAAMPLDILYEDEAMLVLNKPAGVVVHPARGHMDNRTLQNGVLHRYAGKRTDLETTIGPAHRLDRDTSGVIVFSRTRAAYRALVQQFSAREAHKEYLAIVDGAPAFRTVTVQAPLGVDPADAKRGAVIPVAQGGKAAHTDLDVLASGTDWAFLRLHPRTGRPHQVRLHLAHLGLPIVGDRDYNPDPARRGFPRHALHAAALSLAHPVSGELLRFEAPLPQDMQDLLDRLEAHGSGKSHRRDR